MAFTIPSYLKGLLSKIFAPAGVMRSEPPPQQATSAQILRAAREGRQAPSPLPQNLPMLPPIEGTQPQIPPEFIPPEMIGGGSMEGLTPMDIQGLIEIAGQMEPQQSPEETMRQLLTVQMLLEMAQRGGTSVPPVGGLGGGGIG